jgi:hypothetical protein
LIFAVKFKLLFENISVEKIVGLPMTSLGCRGKGNDKDKCGGLSTAQRTMRLSVASVEMTLLLVELE